MEEENCMMRYNYIGREYTLLNLAAGTVLLRRYATSPARGDCKFYHAIPIMHFSSQ